MERRTKRWHAWLVVGHLLAFALAAGGCGGGSELGAAKAASDVGQPESAPSPMLAEEAAVAPGEGSADEAPPAPPSLFDSKAVAAGGPPSKRAPATDVPAPTPGVSSLPDPTTPTARAPLLIYTASVTLAVFGAREAIASVEELAQKSGGYLVSRSDASVTVRVPTRAFQGALDGMKKLGDELHSEVNVRDVTEQFADLEIRLKNAEAVRERLEGFLAKATRVEDALAVERELERVTQTIEQLKGRLKLLAELTAFSTITVNFQARPQDQVGSEVHLPFEWLRQLGLPELLKL